MARTRWWLADPEGTRRRLEAGGVLIGRSPDCDLILRDPKASRAQALVYLDGDAPRLLVLGRGRTLLSGERVEREAKLDHGQKLELPGARFEVLATQETEPPEVGRGWVLDQPGGGYFGISGGVLQVGGHQTDDLHLEGWPDHALTLQTTQGRLHMLAQADLEVDGEQLNPGALVALHPGSQIRFAGQTLRVIAGGDFGHGSTVATAEPSEQALPYAIRLEFLPRGGRLHVRAPTLEQSVYLPGHRCDLMAVLLQPPSPFTAGDLLDDDLVLARVWPHQQRNRVDLNTLIYRLRRDLVAAGIDATSLVQRAAGGGATCVALAQGASVEVG